MFRTINLRRTRLFRFGLFIVIVVGLAWYVAARRADFLRGPVTAPTAAIKEAAKTQPKPEADYFFDARIDRERSRSEETERLREVINSKDTDAGTRREASARLLQISRNGAREVEVESLVRAKGYEDALAFIGNASAVVIVRAKEVSQVDVLRITEIISHVGGLSTDSLRIVARQ